MKSEHLIKAGDLVILQDTSWVDVAYVGKMCVVAGIEETQYSIGVDMAKGITINEVGRKVTVQSYLLIDETGHIITARREDFEPY
jgi:hypothetical protein